MKTSCSYNLVYNLVKINNVPMYLFLSAVASNTLAMVEISEKVQVLNTITENENNIV